MTLIYDHNGTPAIDSGRACAFCGCTDARACPGGCSWSNGSTPEVPICTGCEVLAADLGAYALIAVKQLGGQLGKVLEGSDGVVLTRETLPILLGQQMLVFLTLHELGPHAELDRWKKLEAVRRTMNGEGLPPGAAIPSPGPKAL